MSWPLIVEAVFYAREIGIVPSFRVTDTAPTVDAHTLVFGDPPGKAVAIPDGWEDRPGWDFHKAYEAVDFGGYGQSALAKFFMRYQWRLKELIHYVSPGEQYGIKFGENWGYAYAPGHDNHLHVAIEQGHAVVIRDEMKAQYDAEMERRNRHKKILVQGPDGRVWLADGVTRIHVADHDKTDHVSDGIVILNDTKFVNEAVLNGLVNNTVTRVDDLDAYGKELPGDLLERLTGIQDKINQILGNTS